MSKNPKRTVPIAVLAVALAATLAYVTRRPSGVESYSVRDVVPLGSDQLLLIEARQYRRDTTRSSSGSDRSYRRFRVLDRSGAVVGRLVESTTSTGSWQDHWSLYGVVGDTLWIGQRGNQEKRVYAHRLPAFEVIPGIREAIAKQPMLLRRYEDYQPFVLGTVEQGLVVLGADQRVYVLGDDGRVEQKPKEVKCVPTQACGWREGDREIAVAKVGAAGFDPAAQGPLAGKRPSVKGLDLINAFPTGVSLASPLSVIVRSAEFDAPGSSDLLTRATGHKQGSHGWAADKVQWTVSARDLVQPLELPGRSSVRILWLEARGDRLFALLEAYLEAGHTYQHHLVELDVGTGERVTHRVVKDPEPA